MSQEIIYFDLNMDDCTSIQAKITKIDAIIDSLLTTAVKSVQRGDKLEYSIDTGLTKERVVFSTMESVTKAITNYENIRQLYMNRLTGSAFRNIDERNIRFR